MEKEIKVELQQEINKLIFQKQSENIVAVKEVSEKEKGRIRKKEKKKDKTGLTSSHHMAAEATIRKMKAFLKIKRGLNSSFCTDTEYRSNTFQSKTLKSRFGKGLISCIFPFQVL